MSVRLLALFFRVIAGHRDCPISRNGLSKDIAWIINQSINCRSTDTCHWSWMRTRELTYPSKNILFHITVTNCYLFIYIWNWTRWFAVAPLSEVFKLFLFTMRRCQIALLICTWPYSVKCKKLWLIKHFKQELCR